MSLQTTQKLIMDSMVQKKQNNKILESLVGLLSGFSKQIDDLTKKVDELEKTPAPTQVTERIIIHKEHSVEPPVKKTEEIKREEDAPMFIPSVDTEGLSVKAQKPEKRITDSNMNKNVEELLKIQKEKS